VSADPFPAPPARDVNPFEPLPDNPRLPTSGELSPIVSTTPNPEYSQLYNAEKAAALTRIAAKLKAAQSRCQSNFLLSAMENSWQVKNDEDRFKHEMSMRQMGMSRIIVEIKRVMHNDLSFGMNRWRVNTEKSRPVEYEYIEEEYEEEGKEEDH
jgi:hypothetical protein